MDDRTVLITGAGSGIGRGLAEQLAGDFKILATDLDERSARETAERINGGLGQASAFALDVTREADVHRVLDAMDEPQVDVLINNAGLQYVAKLEEFPQDKWDRLIQVILTGTYVMTRAVLPLMRRHGSGRIINIGSVHSLVASPYKSAYVAAKHGLLGFSRVVALETADVDVTINTICPAYVRTPLVDKQIAAQAREHGLSESEVVSEIMLKPMPKGKFITMEEIAGIVRFLVSDAARNVTGQTVTVDGGWTIR